MAAVYWTLAVLLAFAIGERWRYDDGLRLAAWRNPSWQGPPAYEDLDASLSNDLIGRNPFPLWPAFSIEWRGFLAVDASGDYAFALDTDDGSTLELDGTLVVDNGGEHRLRRGEGRCRLEPGLHPIRVRYFQAGEHSSLHVLWAKDGAPLRTFLPSQLVPDAMSYTEYRWRPARPIAATVLALAACAGLFLGVWPWLRRVAASRGGAAVGRALMAIERPAVAMLAIVAAGLLVRVATLASTPAILWPDSYVFHHTAEEVLAGRWLQHDAYRTFVYPWMLASLRRAGVTASTGVWLVAWQMLMGLVSALLVYLAARRLASPLVALAAALAFALHGLQIFYEASVLTESLFTLALALTIWLAARLFEHPTWRRAGAVGLAAALLVLVRPVAQYYLLVPLSAGLLVRRPWRQRVALAGVMLACHAVPTLWWMGVNQREYGFFGVALGRGMGLYTRVFDLDRLEPPASTAYPELRQLWAVATAEQWSANRVRDELNFGRRYSGARADDAMYRFALEAVQAHPVAFAAATVRQWARQLAAPNAGVRSCPSGVGRYLCSGRAEGESLPGFPNAPAGRSPVRQAVVGFVEEWQVPMAPLVVMAVFGACTFELLQPGYWLLALTIAYLTLVPAISQVPQDRFRLPADPFIFVLAGLGVVRLSTFATRLVDRVRGDAAASPPA